MILNDKDLQMLHNMSPLMSVDPSSVPQNVHPDSTIGRRETDFKIEFDGTTVLCRVCGDKASGFHYGVHSCEGCKGFFRRSIQQKIQYRPCTKNQQCSILRINRNRCQYCRLKKCIAVGMSRDAVRFGRVPKREKAKILAAMQSVNAKSQEKALVSELEDETNLISCIITAHNETCDFTKEKVGSLLDKVRTKAMYATCPPHMACPLNPNSTPTQSDQSVIMEDFSKRFSPAIRGVVDFAKRIPGFGLLSEEDQVTLLKAGVFEVLLVRLACLFDSHSNTIVCLNGQVFKRDSISCASNARFLMDSMFDFSERLNNLNLYESELALFSSIVIIAVDRPGLRNVELIEKMQSKLIQALQVTLEAHHPYQPNLFQELMKKIPDLRTLNTLHSEKLLAFKMEPNNKSIDPGSMVLPVLEDQWNRYAAEKFAQNGVMSPCSGSDPYSSPRSVDSGQGVDSPGSSKGFDAHSVCSGEVAQISEFNVRQHDEHHSMSDETNSPGCPYRVRKVDSPTDSGIECGGKDNANHGTPPTSICSSPRSLDEKGSDSDNATEKPETIDDMPVLKRALQAPPLINTNLLMDEAYKPHKKFRAFRRDSSDGPCSPESTAPHLKGPLASMHSTLVQTLQKGPKYLSEQQMKRTDFIHNIIMNGDGKPEANMAAGPMCNNGYASQQATSVGHFIPSDVVISSAKMPSTNVPSYIPISQQQQTWSYGSSPNGHLSPIYTKSPVSTPATTTHYAQRAPYDRRKQAPSPVASAVSTSTAPIQSAPSLTATSILAAQLAAPLNTIAQTRTTSSSPSSHHLHQRHFTPMYPQTTVSFINGRPIELQPLNLSKRTPPPSPIQV